MEPWASYWDMNRSSTDMTMSADRATAYRTATTAGTWGTAISNSFSGTGNVYVELTIGGTLNNVHIGVVNASAPNIDYPGETTNGLSWSNNGNVYYNSAPLAPPPGFNANAGDTVAVAIYGPLQLIQFRNVTQNSAWSPLYSLAGVGKPPYLLATSLDTAGVVGSVYANFYGPFIGTPPAASPAFTAWNAEALFSEQPVKVIDFDALLTDGSYTSSNINDLEAIPFSYVKWGDAVLDKNYNLVFTDWVIDDLPIFSIVLQVAGPANNWLWAAWDYGTPFVFDKVHIPTSAAVAVANIEIPPPPPTTNPPNVGQGHVLQIFSSCDAASVFTWTQGRVHGTEDVLVWGPVETATRPPSIVGRNYTFTTPSPNYISQAQSSSGSGNIGFPTWQHIPFSSIGFGTVATINGNGDLAFSPAINNLTLQIRGNVIQQQIGSFIYLGYSVDGGPVKPFASIYQKDNNPTFVIQDLGIRTGSVFALYITSTDGTHSTGWAQGLSASFFPQNVDAMFPASLALVPPPLIGAGGGAPPTFPPPTPPPIGAIPPGILVGPAIAAAAVPPSTAGIPLIQFTFGSATTPPASAAFPEFTTTFPSPPIVFSNIFTDGVSPTVPPSTVSTPPLGISYNTGGNWAPPRGPAFPPGVPPVRPFMATIETASVEPEDEEHEPEENHEAEPEPDTEPHDTPPRRPRGRGRRR